MTTNLVTTNQAICIDTESYAPSSFVAYDACTLSPFSNTASVRIYIALRNLVLSLWNLNVREWLTKDTCKQHLICRGLIRIYCVDFLEEILSYLTVKGMINYGLVKPPQQLRVISGAAKKVSCFLILRNHCPLILCKI